MCLDINQIDLITLVLIPITNICLCMCIVEIQQPLQMVVDEIG